MALMTLAVVAGRFSLPYLFLGSGSASGNGTAELAATLLLVGATFFMADGIQGIAAGALRGLNDVRIPLLFAGLSFWIIGFSASYGFAFIVGMGAMGVWLGFSCGLALYAALLVWRFHALTQRGYLPATAPAL